MVVSYRDLPEYDAPDIVYRPSVDSYYFRFNDPVEMIDVPGYKGNWHNLDSMEKDRPLRVIHKAGCNGQNLDYAPDWYPTAGQAIDFKKSTDEEKAVIFGIKQSVSSESVDLMPGDVILRDQRWFGTFSGQAGSRFINITLDTEKSISNEISDKFITTFVSQPLDSGTITAVYVTHVEVALSLDNMVGYTAVINNRAYTILAYDRGKLYLKEGTGLIQVGNDIQVYDRRVYIPLGDNDLDAFASGSYFRYGDYIHADVLDHFPNARSIVTSIQGDPMCNISGEKPVYKSMQDHPQGEEFYYSRFLPECWSQCDLVTTKIYLRQPLDADYQDEPFVIVNKQWYVASVETLPTIPEEHEPECWPVLRIGGADVPHRFRRFAFNEFCVDDLPGDISHCAGRVEPPVIIEDWFEEFEGSFYNAYPNWYQTLEPRIFFYADGFINGYIPPGNWTSHGLVIECDPHTGAIEFDEQLTDSQLLEWKQFATLTRVLTVMGRNFYEQFGNFKDLFVCDLQGDAYKRNLPVVTPQGLEQVQWNQQLYHGSMNYVR